MLQTLGSKFFFSQNFNFIRLFCRQTRRMLVNVKVPDGNKKGLEAEQHCAKVCMKNIWKIVDQRKTLLFQHMLIKHHFSL